MTSTTASLALPLLEEGDPGSHAYYNESMRTLSVLVNCSVISVESTPPATPSNGDRHLVGSAPTDYFVGKDNCIALWDETSSIWVFFTPVEGYYLWLESEESWLQFTGTEWVDVGFGPVELVTASTTQTQGQGALTAKVNIITTCANANDTVTLPSTRKRKICVIMNKGAQTARIYPASGSSIDGGSADAPITLASGSARTFVAASGTAWYSY